MEFIMVDYSKRPLVRLFEALNAYNPTADISLNDVAITAPTIHTGDPLHNTKIVLSPAPNSLKFKNKRSIFYNRLDLQTFFTARGVTSINKGTATNTHELLPLILSQTGVLLEPVDIVLEPITSEPFILHATANSYGWLNSVSFGETDNTVVTLFTLDDGSIFELDDGRFLAIDEPEE